MIVGCGRLISSPPALKAIQEGMTCIQVWSLDEVVDGIRGKKDNRTGRFKSEDYVLEFGPTGLEVKVMNQIWAFGNKVLEIRKEFKIRGIVL